MVKTALYLLGLLCSSHLILGRHPPSEHSSSLQLSLNKDAVIQVTHPNSNGTVILIYDNGKKIGKTGTKYANPSAAPQASQVGLFNLGSGVHRIHLVSQSKDGGPRHLQANINLLEKPRSRKKKSRFARHATPSNVGIQPQASYKGVYKRVYKEEKEEYDEEYDDDEEEGEEGCDYHDDDGDDDDDDDDDDGDDDDDDDDDKSWKWDSEKGWNHRNSSALPVSTLTLVHTVATGDPILTRTVTAPAGNCNIPPVTHFNTETVYVNPTACVPVTKTLTALPTHITQLVTQTIEDEGETLTRVVMQTVPGNVVVRFQTVAQAGVTTTISGATETIAGVTAYVPVAGVTTTAAGATETIAGETTTIYGDTTTELDTTTVGEETITIAEATVTTETTVTEPTTTTVRTTLTNNVTRFIIQTTRITTVQTASTAFVTVPVTQSVQQTVTVVGQTSTTTENVVVTLVRPRTTTTTTTA